jgi:hypothetical protein
LIDAWKNNKGITLKISEHHYNNYAEKHTPRLNKKNEAKVKRAIKNNNIVNTAMSDKTDFSQIYLLQ